MDGSGKGSALFLLGSRERIAYRNRHIIAAITSVGCHGIDMCGSCSGCINISAGGIHVGDLGIVAIPRYILTIRIPGIYLGVSGIEPGAGF
ncbi:unknown [Clostridium sp. CAG:448]|nr:unknown [Clostridium sp. CAG:448]